MTRAVIVLVALSSVARAEPEVTLAWIPGTPSVSATIRGVPSTVPDQISLRVGKATVRAATVTSYAQGPDPLALAIVYCGQEIWIGNDDVEPPGSPARTSGALATMRRSLDKVNLARLVPAGSLGTLITYADRAQIRVPLGPIARITGSALGTQRDYHQQIGTELVAGIELAINTLRTASTSRRVLLVIGDGNDTNADTAKDALRELAEVAARDGLESHAIIVRSALSEPQNMIAHMMPRAVEVASAEALGPVIESVLRGLDDRFHARFDHVPMGATGIPRKAVVTVGGIAIETELTLPKGYRLPEDTRWRWRLLGAAIAVLGIVGLAIGWRKRRIRTGMSRSTSDGPTPRA